jgi:carbonic anhydrase
VVRVAGNFVTPDGLASLEFGAAVLGTKVIMVLGHSSCGAVATVSALQKGNRFARPHRQLGARHQARRRAGAQLGRRRLGKTRSCRHRAAAAAGEADPGRHGRQRKLRVVGGVYDLATGKVSLV